MWERMLSETPPGNEGSLGFYFHSPEITPSTGERQGVFRYDAKDERVERFGAGQEVRAVVESKFLAMRLYLRGIGVEQVRRVVATGGASSNQGILQVLADVFQVKVYTLQQSDSASLGAAMRALHGYRSASGGSLEGVVKLAAKVRIAGV